MSHHVSHSFFKTVLLALLAASRAFPGRTWKRDYRRVLAYSGSLSGGHCSL